MFFLDGFFHIQILKKICFSKTIGMTVHSINLASLKNKNVSLTMTTRNRPIQLDINLLQLPLPVITSYQVQPLFLTETKRLKMAAKHLITRILIILAGFFLFTSSPTLFWNKLPIGRNLENWPGVEICHYQHLRAVIVLNIFTCIFGLGSIISEDLDKFKKLKYFKSSYLLACTWILSLISTAVYLNKLIHCGENMLSWEIIFLILSFVFYTFSIIWPVVVWLKDDEEGIRRASWVGRRISVQSL